jgi:pSer/pThr/pTyr-binding forkhead associated (FHA) protein
VKLAVLKNHRPINSVTVETPDPNERYEIFVGRSEDCHVVIDDPLISRHHFVLKSQSGSWICERLTKLAPLSINGNSADKVDLHEGDEIKFGAYSLVVTELPLLQEPHLLEKEVGPVDDLPDDSLLVNEDSNLDELMDSPSLPEADSGPIDTQPSQEVIDEDIAGFDLGDEEISNFNNQDIVTNDEYSEDALLPSDLDAYSNDIGPESDLEEEKTSVFQSFVNYQLLISGEFAPYDRFQIDLDEIFIGRDTKKCQIILDDPEVSSVHAVVRKNFIDVVLEDLKSSNGTILNGDRINKAVIHTGDEFIIGSTRFVLDTRSDLLEAEADRLMPVESDQFVETEEIEEEVMQAGESTDVDFSTDALPDKSLLSRFKKDKDFRKKVIWVGAVLIIFWALFSDEITTNNAAKKPDVAKANNSKTDSTDVPKKLQLSKELEEKRNQSYELGVSFFEQSKYFEALKEFQTVASIDPAYKRNESYLLQTKEGLKRLEELEAQRRAEQERIKNKKIIEELLVKAREAVKEKNAALADTLFTQIIGMDPENLEVQQLKMELEAWQKEQERIAQEKALKDAARKAMIDALSPGKTFYLKKEWYKAILRLEEFLARKGLDEDLIKEASDMLSEAKNQLNLALSPILENARSLKEGQDLKSAYESYLEILKIDPTHSVALNEVDSIREQLETRAKKIYREAIIAESLSLFADAKEKFTEVQQISPTDSEYYIKATEKLRNYLE